MKGSEGWPSLSCCSAEIMLLGVRMLVMSSTVHSSEEPDAQGHISTRNIDSETTNVRISHTSYFLPLYLQILNLKKNLLARNVQLYYKF
jgi:hypothetical protein